MEIPSHTLVHKDTNQPENPIIIRIKRQEHRVGSAPCMRLERKLWISHCLGSIVSILSLHPPASRSPPPRRRSLLWRIYVGADFQNPPRRMCSLRGHWRGPMAMRDGGGHVYREWSRAERVRRADAALNALSLYPCLYLKPEPVAIEVEPHGGPLHTRNRAACKLHRKMDETHTLTQ